MVVFYTSKKNIFYQKALKPINNFKGTMVFFVFAGNRFYPPGKYYCLSGSKNSPL